MTWGQWESLSFDSSASENSQRVRTCWARGERMTTGAATDKLPDSIFQRILLKFEDRGGPSMTPEEKRHWLHNRCHLLRIASRIGKLEFFDLYMTSDTTISLEQACCLLLPLGQ